MLQVHIVAKPLPAGEPGRHAAAVQDYMVNDSSALTEPQMLRKVSVADVRTARIPGKNDKKV
ncbi:hypothetical protein F7R13_15555 [Burkholderia territorii]|uniref:Uncharacterized protein n=1 Tax=Burkholderia territorii TaxID=1503055 RepID=A0A6L3NGW8_9BURK|nr:hypothetical protein F7R13_15555 [Burkholderia territorii]